MNASIGEDRQTVATLRDVVKRFGSTLALDHVDFEIAPGEILGLLGPNGAGKTTAIRALAGLVGIDSGAIEVFGAAQRPGVMDLKRRIGLVTQEITVFDDLSARENLQFFGGLYGLRGQELKDRIAETLAFVGLAENAEKRVKKYSGGMKRRLNVACALTHRPELLVMDEPTVGIDPQSRNHILEQVRALSAEGHDHRLHLPLHGGGAGHRLARADHGPGPHHRRRHRGRAGGPYPLRGARDHRGRGADAGGRGGHRQDRRGQAGDP